jgi:hypothetical protein
LNLAEPVFVVRRLTLLDEKKPAIQIAGRAFFNLVSMIEECAKYPANMQKVFSPCFLELKGRLRQEGLDMS